MLKAEHLSFYYTDQKPVLKNLKFNIRKNEIISILGESGSGKSTLLKLIYGLEDATQGNIFFNNEIVRGPKYNLVPGNSLMKFVPQEFNLLDSISVAENTGKYLSNFDLPKKKRAIVKALKAVDLLELKDKFPFEMSGGQRQRVSIATALAAQPTVLLLDEPYGHLDQPLKFKIRKGIWKWAKENDCTLLITTHDSDDAMGFSDRIFILKNGKIIQKGSPKELKENPKSEYVAGIMGEYSVLSPVEMSRLFNIENQSKAIVYPEEFLIDSAGTQFNITDIRFRGRDYLVTAINNGTEIKFYSEERPENSSIFLKIKSFRTVKR